MRNSDDIDREGTELATLPPCTIKTNNINSWNTTWDSSYIIYGAIALDHVGYVRRILSFIVYINIDNVPHKNTMNNNNK